MITSIEAPDAAYQSAVDAVGADRVLVPALLKLHRADSDAPPALPGGSR